MWVHDEAPCCSGVTQSFVTQDPEWFRRRQRDLFQRQQGRASANYKAKHERFITLESRMDTLTNWPEHLSQRPQQLAEAGMYYTGVDDYVVVSLVTAA
ncbi:death-associated inhibitor of apoptosis 1-like [Dreissena polymorpha]|uniref:death-associated inhibitor of apoptosis 1-like n=1 Tax=Dreissena polymorpha TaxID=45954 RepID=UPI0022651957|nr:death-associated inhibitor of apoptosis 1-like [Dreissena polymorpha]